MDKQHYFVSLLLKKPRSIMMQQEEQPKQTTSSLRRCNNMIRTRTRSRLRLRSSQHLFSCQSTTIRLFMIMTAIITMMFIPQVAANQRSLFVRGPLATEYVAEVARFGNQLEFSTDESLYANLMLPPDNPWMCEYPESLKNITEEDLATQEHLQFSQDIALFVSINRCSAETKARVIQQMRERITHRIKLVILYSTNPQDFTFVSLRTDDGSDPPELRDFALLYIPHRYASGIDLRMRMQYQGDDPRFTYPGSQYWNFPIEVTHLSPNIITRSGTEQGYGGDIYWFRVILFSLLIASPCFRACYLWYAGGGRLHWRRNENGRIVGIQYIPPMPLWLSTGRPASDSPGPVGVLTEEQFNELPEIVYSGIPEKDGGTESEEEPDDNVDVQSTPIKKETDNSRHGWSTHTSGMATNEGVGDEDASVEEVPAPSNDDDGNKSDNLNDANSEDKPETPRNNNVITEPDESESKFETIPSEKSAPDAMRNPTETKADDSERTVDQVPPLEEDGFLIKSSISMSTNEELSAGPLHDDVDNSTKDGRGGTASIFGQAKSLTTGDFSRMAEEEIVFGLKSSREWSSSSASSDDEDDDDGDSDKSEEIIVEKVDEESDAEEGPQKLVQEKEADDSVRLTVGVNKKDKPSVEHVTNAKTGDVEAPDDPPANNNHTISTSCAICIDEFEQGERLTLLPRCRHAFHRECIHAWLIERQGCCPLCKLDVMEPASGNREADADPADVDVEAPTAVITIPSQPQESPRQGTSVDLGAPPPPAENGRPGERRRGFFGTARDAFSF